MGTAVKWEDDFFYSKNRITLTSAQIHIPGIKLLGHHSMSNAVDPLVDHYHDHCFEFTVISEGSYTFHTNQRTYNTNGGNVFIAYPNEVHSTSQMPLSNGDFFWFQLDISNPAEFLFLNTPAANSLIDSLYKISKHVIRPKDDELSNIARSVFNSALLHSSVYLTSSYLVLFLNRLIAISNEQVILSKEILCALDYIFDNLGTEITLKELAENIHLSESQFKTKFKNEIGISPRNFINKQKIEVAKSLLLEGESKTKISNELGFNTSSYFSAVFKKYTLSTPSEYVKRHTFLNTNGSAAPN